MKNEFIIDPSLLDLDRPIADIEAIRQLNPQRYEMEQLTAILYEDFDNKVCAALKEVTEDEFWVRGHMPGTPLMPGVMMLEAAAQLSCYYAIKNDLLGGGVVGFGGVDECRFRGVVRPGDRLILMVEMLKARRGRMIIAKFQGVVEKSDRARRDPARYRDPCRLGQCLIVGRRVSRRRFLTQPSRLGRNRPTTADGDGHLALVQVRLRGCASLILSRISVRLEWWR